MGKKFQIRAALSDLMLQGLSDVEIARQLGEPSAAGVRRLMSMHGLLGAKKWRCPNCGFEMMSKEQPRCRRHSIHVVPFSDYEKSYREDGLLMEEVDE